MKDLKYILSCSGKFHYFELAKVLYDKDKLKNIISGYPWFKLKNSGIPKKFVSSNGLIRMLRHPIIKSRQFKKIDEHLNIINSKIIDNATCKQIDKNTDADVLLSFAGVGRKSGKKAKENNKIYICDSTSAHIIEQNNLLAEEYNDIVKRKFQINPKVIESKIEEYRNANLILVPSNFVKKSFEKHNFKNIRVLNLNSSINNFYPHKKIKRSAEFFDIMFIGQLSLQKGLHYLIDAFKKFKHPKKRLHIIGHHSEDKEFFEKKMVHENIIHYGQMKQEEINTLANKCHVNVLPSIQDGWGLVVSQSSAAGCPNIVSENVGALDFVKKYKTGFSVPIKNSNSILEKFELLCDDKSLWKELSSNGIKHSGESTWEEYIKKLEKIVLDIS